jgi:hypothetical protein
VNILAAHHKTGMGLVIVEEQKGITEDIFFKVYISLSPICIS